MGPEKWGAEDRGLLVGLICARLEWPASAKLVPPVGYVKYKTSTGCVVLADTARSAFPHDGGAKIQRITVDFEPSTGLVRKKRRSAQVLQLE